MTTSRAPSTPAPTFGVEEEFALLDPSSGQVALLAPEIIRDCRGRHGIVAESMTYMVESRTPVCRTLDEAAYALRGSRTCIAAEARRRKAVAVASGVAPYGVPMPPPLTDNPRYRELAAAFPEAMSRTGTCGCHVHVAVPTRQAGVEALLRIRPWLPALIALTANSPIWEGEETAWASIRFVFATRWPTGTPPPPVRSAVRYDELIDQAVAAGKAPDVRSVYYLARLSPRYPTVEVRIADMSFTIDETVAYAGLVRALVATAIEDAGDNEPVVVPTQHDLQQACRQAAQVGLAGAVVDPLTGEPVPTWGLVDALVTYVLPHLRAFGDEERVMSTLYETRLAGGGADRQRRMFEESPCPERFVAALVAAADSPVGAY